jgi:hypothetical protein
VSTISVLGAEVDVRTPKFEVDRRAVIDIPFHCIPPFLARSVKVIMTYFLHAVCRAFEVNRDVVTVGLL